jgi:hypothetical protein
LARLSGSGALAARSDLGVGSVVAFTLRKQERQSRRLIQSRRHEVQTANCLIRSTLDARR